MPRYYSIQVKQSDSASLPVCYVHIFDTKAERDAMCFGGYHNGHVAKSAREAAKFIKSNALVSDHTASFFRQTIRENERSGY